MTYVKTKCACGIFLRYVTSRRRYEPLAGSGAPLEGHVPAVVVKDGRPEVVRPDAVCAAVVDELAPRRAQRRGRRRSA